MHSIADNLSEAAREAWIGASLLDMAFYHIAKNLEPREPNDVAQAWDDEELVTAIRRLVWYHDGKRSQLTIW